jgi:hypothetical protein
VIELPEPNPVVPEPCECGGEAMLQRRQTRGGDWFVVECLTCGRQGHLRPEGIAAVEEWNTCRELVE